MVSVYFNTQDSPDAFHYNAHKKCQDVLDAVYELNKIHDAQCLNRFDMITDLIEAAYVDATAFESDRGTLSIKVKMPEFNPVRIALLINAVENEIRGIGYRTSQFE